MRGSASTCASAVRAKPSLQSYLPLHLRKAFLMHFAGAAVLVELGGKGVEARGGSRFFSCCWVGALPPLAE